MNNLLTARLRGLAAGRNGAGVRFFWRLLVLRPLRAGTARGPIQSLMQRWERIDAAIYNRRLTSMYEAARGETYMPQAS